MMKTMRKVAIVVVLLMTSCHCAENPKIGPLAAQARMTATAPKKAQNVPVATATRSAN
jgi:hypothetical protein